MKRIAIVLIASLVCSYGYSFPPRFGKLRIECKKAKAQRKARKIKQKKENVWPPSSMTPPSN